MLQTRYTLYNIVRIVWGGATEVWILPIQEKSQARAPSLLRRINPNNSCSFLLRSSIRLRISYNRLDVRRLRKSSVQNLPINFLSITRLLKGVLKDLILSFTTAQRFSFYLRSPLGIIPSGGRLSIGIALYAFFLYIVQVLQISYSFRGFPNNAPNLALYSGG